MELFFHLLNLIPFHNLIIKLLLKEVDQE